MITLLEKKLNNINIVLDFLGYSAKINNNDRKKLNIYDESGVFYKSVITRFDIEFNFEDKNGKLIKYTINDNTHNISFCNTKIELIEHPKTQKFISFRIIKYYEDNDTTNDFSISTDSIDVAIESDNTRRFVGYTDRLTNFSAIMCETDPINGPHNLTVGSFGIGCNSMFYVSNSKSKKFKSIRPLFVAKNIITHPRNKNLIGYVIKELNNEFLGIKEFIENNFALYNSIMNTEYSGNEFITLLIESNINNNLDISQKKKVL